tara:strand:- start:287 stop:871 length:585 start_codon:yes stop_codon:yes gene_type:complete
MKRLFDFTASLFGLIILSPLFLLVALIIKISSKGPILFKQKRIGKNGNIFTLVKFRSMKIVQQTTTTVSVKGDKRITIVGAFLRRFKLDELPELWNVLVGEMSLVGPRPDVPGFADLLEGNDRLILNLRPGITGPASLKYANEEEILAKVTHPEKYNKEVIFPDKVRINLDYYNRQNIWLDLKIIFATIFRTNY